MYLVPPILRVVRRSPFAVRRGGANRGGGQGASRWPTSAEQVGTVSPPPPCPPVGEGLDPLQEDSPGHSPSGLALSAPSMRKTIEGPALAGGRLDSTGEAWRSGANGGGSACGGRVAGLRHCAAEKVSSHGRRASNVACAACAGEELFACQPAARFSRRLTGEADRQACSRLGGT